MGAVFLLRTGLLFHITFCVELDGAPPTNILESNFWLGYAETWGFAVNETETTGITLKIGYLLLSTIISDACLINAGHGRLGNSLSGPQETRSLAFVVSISRILNPGFKTSLFR